MIERDAATVLISIVIPACNEAVMLPATLQHIARAFQANVAPDLSWEIIVCDNNSTDDTSAAAARLGAKVVFEPVNSIARARNTGATAAQGDWLLFIDADSHPSRELIGELLELIRDGTHIGCGATVAVEGGTLFNKLRMERLNPLFRLFKFGGGDFLLSETEAFQTIGGFSPDLYAYEEIDFVRRLKRHGRKRGKSFAILHRHPVTTSGRKGEYTFGAIVSLVLSNVAATAALLLHLVLPRGWLARLGPRWFGYWYGRRR